MGAVEPEIMVANVVEALDAGAVGAEDLVDVEGGHLRAEPLHRALGCLVTERALEHVKATDDGCARRVAGPLRADEGAGGLDRVDDAGVGAAREDDDSLRRVEDERVLLGDEVRSRRAVRADDRGGARVRLLVVMARDLSGQPHARQSEKGAGGLGRDDDVPP